MKRSLSLVLLLCLIGVCRSFEGSHSDVVVLTDDNFDDLTSEGSWLLEFYAPWCGHCKKLAPIYDDAARKLAGKINLGKVDCTAQTKLASRFEIKSYPTMKFKRGKDVRSYTGARSLEGIVEFGNVMSAPPLQAVTSQKQLKKLSKSNPVTFVLFANPNSDQLTLFQQIAFNMQGLVKFAHVSIENDQGKSIADKYNVKADELPAVMVLSKGADSDLFTGPWEEDKLNSYISSRRYPLISELDGGNFEDLTNAQKLLVLIIIDPSNDRHKEYLEQIYPAAKFFRGKLNFASVDGIKFSKYVEQFGIKDVTDMPTVTVLDYPDYYYNSKELHSQGPLPVEKVSDFLNGVLNGEIKATGTVPWYNPAKYLKMAEKFLSKLSTPALVGVCVLGMGIFIGFIFMMCKCLGGFDDYSEEALEAVRPKPKEGDETSDTSEEPDESSESTSSSDSATQPTVRKREGKPKARRAD